MVHAMNACVINENNTYLKLNEWPDKLCDNLIKEKDESAKRAHEKLNGVHARLQAFSYCCLVHSSRSYSLLLHFLFIFRLLSLEFGWYFPPWKSTHNWRLKTLKKHHGINARIMPWHAIELKVNISNAVDVIDIKELRRCEHTHTQKEIVFAHKWRRSALFQKEIKAKLQISSLIDEMKWTQGKIMHLKSYTQEMKRIHMHLCLTVATANMMLRVKIAHLHQSDDVICWGEIIGNN